MMTKADSDLKEQTQKLVTTPVIEVSEDILRMRKQIGSLTSAKQDLDHEMQRMQVDIRNLEENFKSFALASPVDEELNDINDFCVRSFDVVYSKLNRLKVAVVIAIIIGVIGCIL